MTLAETVAGIVPADAAAMQRAAARHLTLTKPPGSLGRLEAVSIQLAGIFGSERPVVRDSALIVAAGDHGVVAQGVTGYPQAVTAQMVANFPRRRRRGERDGAAARGAADRGGRRHRGGRAAAAS